MNKFLAGKYFDYQEVIELVSENLSSIQNLKEYCKLNGLHYNTILLIKNKYPKQFPKVVAKLLELFGYKVEIFTAFKFLDKKEV